MYYLWYMVILILEIKLRLLRMISIFVETEYTCHMSRVDILQQEAKIPVLSRGLYMSH